MQGIRAIFFRKIPKGGRALHARPLSGGDPFKGPWAPGPSEEKGVAARRAWLQRFFASAADKVQREGRVLMSATFVAPALEPLRIVYGHTSTCNYELVSALLATYLILRMNVLHQRQGSALIKMPPNLQFYASTRNEVVKIKQNRSVVSMEQSMLDMQLHNVLSADDPFSLSAKLWWERLVSRHVDVDSNESSERNFRIDMLRTGLMVCKHRCVEMLQYFKEHGLISTTADIVRFNMTYEGPFGDRSTTETATTVMPEIASVFLWETLRPTGRGVLDKMIEERSAAKMIGALHAFYGFGGTGFVAATCTHILIDMDRDSKLLKLRNDEYLFTAVGPNPRKLINMLENRPLHQHQYGGDDGFYQHKLQRLTQMTQQRLPPGSDGIWKRRLGNMRVAQFNLCKLLTVLQYMQSGLVGNHGRKRKRSEQLEAFSSDSEDDMCGSDANPS